MRKIMAAFLCCLWFPVSANGDVFVLCYHTFLDKPKNEYDISKETFKSHIESIKSLGYPFFSFDDILNGKGKDENGILMTIDDGNHSIPSVYDDILKANGIKPLLAIYPNPIVNKQPEFVTFDTLQQYIKDGATIASHGYYHLYINSKLFEKNPTDFKTEVYKSKEVLEKRLSVKVNIFVYPFGLVTDIGKEHIKKAGYQYAFSIEHGALKVPLELNPDIWNLPRYMVTKSAWNGIYNVLKKNAPKKKMGDEK